MDYSSTGFLEFHAFTAGEALPIPNINIRITGGEEANRGTDYSLLTDINGETATVPLPAPSLLYSLSPNPPEQPYSKYDVEISGIGYYPKKLVGISVFPDIKSILKIEMVPDSEFSRNVTSPFGTDFSVIQEKEELK